LGHPKVLGVVDWQRLIRGLHLQVREAAFALDEVGKRIRPAWQVIATPTRFLQDYRSQGSNAEAVGHAFGLHVVGVDGGTADRACGLAAPGSGSWIEAETLLRRRLHDLVANREGRAVDNGAEGDVATLLAGEPSLADERHLMLGKRGVRAADRAGP